jgi:hypothetical protein
MPRMRYVRKLLMGIAFVGLSCGGFAACVGDDSSGNPDATTDSGTDVTTQDVTQDVDSGVGCSARTADDTSGVFVSQDGNDVGSCGTRSNPCKTLIYSIAAAKSTSGKTILYVAAPPPASDGGADGGGSTGTYQESIILDAPISIEGGWADKGGTWTPICDTTTSTAVTIEGTTNTTITASFNGSATLRDIRVVSKPSADPSESLYGIFALGSSTSLTLDQVVVDVGAGGIGTDGVDGGVGASTAADAGCAASNGAAGGAGATGTGGAAGTFSSTGYVETDGTDGGNGVAGHAGTAGGNGACASCDVFVGTCPGTCNFGSQNECAGNGIAGCGGGGGGGGSAGTGGGASIAVFLWDAKLTVFGGSFTTSNGGNGGNGGAGAGGGNGNAGAKGADKGCATSLSNPGCVGSVCTGSYGGGYTLDGGTAGGGGGHGGAGASGGGGSGGASYDIVQGGDAGVTLNGSPMFVYGDGGTGGVLGGANGTAGDKWP